MPATSRLARRAAPLGCFAGSLVFLTWIDSASACRLRYLLPRSPRPSGGPRSAGPRSRVEVRSIAAPSRAAAAACAMLGASGSRHAAIANPKTIYFTFPPLLFSKHNTDPRHGTDRHYRDPHPDRDVAGRVTRFDASDPQVAPCFSLAQREAGIGDLAEPAPQVGAIQESSLPPVRHEIA